MTTAPLFDMVEHSVTGTPGTGTITLGAAVSGYQTFASAGAVNGDIVSYSISDTGNAWEVGHATYNSSGPTLSSRVVTFSSNSNAAVSLTSAAIVCNSLLVADIEIKLNANAVTANQAFSSALPANAVILYGAARETAGYAGTVAIGSTSGDTDVMAATPVPASGLTLLTADSFSLIWSSATATWQLYLTVSGASAVFNVFLIYRIGP
jgi:hypothetical protein